MRQFIGALRRTCEHAGLHGLEQRLLGCRVARSERHAGRPRCHRACLGARELVRLACRALAGLGQYLVWFRRLELVVGASSCRGSSLPPILHHGLQAKADTHRQRTGDPGDTFQADANSRQRQRDGNGDACIPEQGGGRKLHAGIEFGSG